MAKGVWTEMGIGDASVVVPSIDTYDQDKFIPVAFMFDKENPRFKVHGKCKPERDYHQTRSQSPEPGPAPDPDPNPNNPKTPKNPNPKTPTPKNPKPKPKKKVR